MAASRVCSACCSASSCFAEALLVCSCICRVSSCSRSARRFSTSCSSCFSRVASSRCRVSRASSFASAACTALSFSDNCDSISLSCTRTASRSFSRALVTACLSRVSASSRRRASTSTATFLASTAPTSISVPHCGHLMLSVSKILSSEAADAASIRCNNGCPSKTRTPCSEIPAPHCAWPGTLLSAGACMATDQSRRHPATCRRSR